MSVVISILNSDAYANDLPVLDGGAPSRQVLRREWSAVIVVDVDDAIPVSAVTPEVSA